mgnify:CR=1 FL=1
MPPTPLDVLGLGHTYGELRALDSVRFAVQPGEIFGLLGPNGGGKTTLFRILSTLMRPREGTARVFGYDLLHQPDEVRRRIGIVFQASSVDGKLTAAENMRHQGHLYGMRGARLETQSRELLDRVGLLDRRDAIVETFSGGQRRRVELAKGLLHGPRLLLLDEPTTGLDPVARRDLWSYLNILRAKDGIAVLITTHLMEEAENCDRLAILNRGRIVALGSPAELKREIEGDVLVIETGDPERLRRDLVDRFQQVPQVLGSTVRLERPRAHEFIPVLLAAFPDAIRSVTLGKPTLEDVFIHRTGETLQEVSA